MLKFAAEEELPPPASRATIARARDDVASTMTPYGKLHQVLKIPRNEGEPLDLEVQAPHATFYNACAQSAAFSTMVARAIARVKPTMEQPWHIVLYLDEVLPGNALSHTQNRKLWACYWTIAEFGGVALSHEVFGTLESTYRFCLHVDA